MVIILQYVWAVFFNEYKTLTVIVTKRCRLNLHRFLKDVGKHKVRFWEMHMCSGVLWNPTGCLNFPSAVTVEIIHWKMESSSWTKLYLKKIGKQYFKQKLYPVTCKIHFTGACKVDSWRETLFSEEHVEVAPF